MCDFLMMGLFERDRRAARIASSGVSGAVMRMTRGKEANIGSRRLLHGWRTLARVFFDELSGRFCVQILREGGREGAMQTDGGKVIVFHPA